MGSAGQMPQQSEIAGPKLRVGHPSDEPIRKARVMERVGNRREAQALHVGEVGIVQCQS
jgi:hypothetical protein